MKTTALVFRSGASGSWQWSLRFALARYYVALPSCGQHAYSIVDRLPVIAIDDVDALQLDIDTKDA